MHDDDLNRIFRSLDEPAEPDPTFRVHLYGQLQAELRGEHGGVARRRSSLAPLAAAAVVIAAIGLGVAAGAGFVRLPWVVADASQTPSPSQTPDGSPAPSVDGEAAPSATAAPTAQPGPGMATGTVLFAEADGLRLRSEPSENGEVRATLRRGQLMGATGETADAQDMTWYEVRIGPGTLTGWVAAGPDHGWVRLVTDGAIGFICEGGCGTGSLVSVTPFGDAAITAISNEVYREWTWSPDGTRIAATVDGGDAGEAEIVVMDADGANRQSLGAGYGPAWSPDGTRLAWSVDTTLVVTDEELAPASLDLALRGAGTPMWSPDGASLAFGAIDCPECPVDEPIFGDPPVATWIVGVDGTGLRQLTGGDYSALADWSPDGTTLAYSQFDLSGEFPMRAYLLSVDGGERRYLEDGGAVTAAPTWSPDGQLLLYGTPEGLVFTNGDGTSAPRAVSPNDLGSGTVAWSPSGTWIVFHSALVIDEVEQPGIWVAPIDGSAPAFQISPREAFVSREAWQPVLTPLR